MTRTRGSRAWPGFLFLVVVGTAWHFVYALAGSAPVVGLVAPVNESVWEHAKLIAVPMLMWAALRAWRDGTGARAVVAGAAGAVAGVATMLLGYYGYVAVLGTRAFPMDIALFLACAAVALGGFDLALRRLGDVPWWVAAAVVASLLFAFALLTVAPPAWPMFQPPSG